MIRVYWKNGKWCLEPGSAEESNALRVVFENLKLAPPGWEVGAGPFFEEVPINWQDEEFVAGADKGAEEVG